MEKPSSVEECKTTIFASATPLPAAPDTSEPITPRKPSKPKIVLPGEHLEIFPPTLPADTSPPLASEPVGDLLPPAYMFGWHYTNEAFRERYMGGGRSFEEDMKRFAKEHQGVKPPALDAAYVITNDFMIYLGTNLFEWARHCAEDRERVEVIRDFLGEDEPTWHRPM
ncbi:hypothetical protein GGF50DRAFT_84896 [Schizophyllum commune]